MEVIQQYGWGRMVSTNQKIAPYNGELWGFDNGAWWAHKNNQPFDEELFLKRFAMMEKVGKPYLAVTPDIVGGGMESLRFSNKWITQLAKNGWNWYLAVQDGMDYESVRKALSAYPYKGIFLGGTDRFKATASQWVKLAKEFNIPFHYGRCGTAPKIRKAYRVGADSCDSAFPHWIKKGGWRVILKAIEGEESIRHKQQCQLDRVCGHQEWLGYFAAKCAKNPDVNIKECFPHRPKNCPKHAPPPDP